jgi:hypothetical protein
MSGDPLLEAARNLSRYHHEHEKHYAFEPLEGALTLQRISRTLKALAERWSTAEPSRSPAPSPFAGAEDLNDERAIEESGVLFMEGGGEPAEMSRLKRDLATIADDAEQSGQWLAKAMEAAWGAAAGLTRYPELADLLGERHRIIANDWQNAQVAQLNARLLRRALEVLDQVDLAPASLRADLAGERRSPAYLFAASELIDRAADLGAESAVLVHENERRWRVFHRRLANLESE